MIEEDYETQQALPVRQSAKHVAQNVGQKNGMTTEELLIVWLYLWGFSIEKIASYAAGSSPDAQRGLLARLERKGLTQRVESPRSKSLYIYLLTNTGVEKAQSLVDVDIKYDTNPARVNHNKINHDLATQLLTSLRIRDIDSYISERQLRGQFTKGKVVDAIWGVGQKTGIECEVESKSGSDLDKMLVGLCQSIEQGVLYAAIVFMTNYERADRYKVRLKETMGIWHIKNGQKPQRTGEYTAPTEVVSRIYFCVIPDMLAKL